MHSNNIYCISAHSLSIYSMFRKDTAVIFYYDTYSTTPRLLFFFFFCILRFLHSYIFYRIKITELEMEKISGFCSDRNTGAQIDAESSMKENKTLPWSFKTLRPASKTRALKCIEQNSVIQDVPILERITFHLQFFFFFFLLQVDCFILITFKIVSFHCLILNIFIINRQVWYANFAIKMSIFVIYLCLKFSFLVLLIRY